MMENVVVATDGGSAGRAALDWTIDRALRSPIEVEVVAVEETDWLPLGADEQQYRRKYVEVLTAAEKHLANRHGISRVTTNLLSGRPANELTDVSQHADALVIGSNRTNAAVGALHGTLALRLAARTVCRLVVVPSDWEPHPGLIVVGVDDDESSIAAVDAAATEAHRNTSDLLLVHAWSIAAPFSILDAFLKTSYPSLEALHQQRLDSMVARAAEIAPHSHITQLLKFGSADDVLADASRGAQVLFVGSHHRGVLRDLVLGSVSHDVLMAALCPVVVVPTAEAFVRPDPAYLR
jgi:nucleotide-binding universal stress UspA family protein